MDPRIAAIADILRLNTKLFRNCLDGFTDAQARVRPSATMNSAAFVAAHVAYARYLMLRVLGAERPNPLASYLAGSRSIDQMEKLPSLAESQKAWADAAHALRDRLDAISAAELDAVAKSPFPGPEQSVLGLLTFLAQHDSYHVGQLAMLRK